MWIFQVLIFFMFGAFSFSQSGYAQVDRWPVFINGSENETHQAVTLIRADELKGSEIHELEIFQHRLFMELLEEGYVAYQGCTYFIVPQTFDDSLLGSILEVTDAHLVSLTPKFAFEGILDFYQRLSDPKKAEIAHLIMTVPNFEQMKYCPYKFNVGCQAEGELILGRLPFRLESEPFKKFVGSSREVPTFEITCDKARTLARIVGKHLFCGRGAIVGNLFNTVDAALNLDGQWCLKEDYLDE